MRLDVQNRFPPVDGGRVHTIADGHIHEPLFQQAEARGQSQGVTQLHQQVVVVVNRPVDEITHELLVLRGHVEDADGRIDGFHHEGVGNADLGGLDPAPGHAVAVAVDEMPLGGDSGVAADVMENAVDVGLVRVQPGAAGGNVPAGLGDVPAVIYPGAGIRPTGLLQGLLGGVSGQQHSFGSFHMVMLTV